MLVSASLLFLKTKKENILPAMGKSIKNKVVQKKIKTKKKYGVNKDEFFLHFEQ